MAWYERYGWNSNPFETKPMPDLISGFEDIRKELLEFIKSGDCCILIGPTGSGKTTLLKWLEKYALEEGFPIYINTSGMRQEEIDKINIDKLVRNKLGFLDIVIEKKKKIIMLIDEAHTLPPIIGKSMERNFDEHKIKSLVLASSVDNPTNLKENILQRAGQRKIRIRQMKSNEAMDMISNRVKYKNPFEPGSLDIIFKKAGHKPGSILELCELVAKENIDKTITKDFVERYFAEEETKPRKEDFINKLSPLQRKIVETLETGSLRPKEIAVKLEKPTKTITSQLAYLGLKSRVSLMKRKGIEKPVVEKASDKPAVYKLTDEVKNILDSE